MFIPSPKSLPCQWEMIIKLCKELIEIFLEQTWTSETPEPQLVR